MMQVELNDLKTLQIYGQLSNDGSTASQDPDGQLEF